VSVVREFESAFNRADIPGLLRCFTEDATYIDTFYGSHTGHGKLRAMFERMFHEGLGYRWRMERVVESETLAAAEWTFTYTVTDAVPRSAGRPVRFPGMSIFEVDRGRIQSYREYFDMGGALLQLGFSAESTAKVLRRYRLGAPEMARPQP
jgi:steroid delta-isomerase-like uncharacterized protein